MVRIDPLHGDIGNRFHHQWYFLHAGFAGIKAEGFGLGLSDLPDGEIAVQYEAFLYAEFVIVWQEFLDDDELEVGRLVEFS